MANAWSAAGRAPALAGSVAPPGDKSISHRAILFGALAEGETLATGILEGHDVLRTAAAARALGARVERDLTDGGPVWRVEGAPWRSPERALYFGNSGTGCRLMMGAIAGRGIAAAFDGDESLRSRPMRRIVEPLALMGARLVTEEGRLPASLAAGRLKGIDYRLPVASAQVKSAVLLAGLGAEGETLVEESEPSRDHTERMLAAFGATISIGERNGARLIRLGASGLKATRVDVPGDPSSAAFLAAAAAIVPGSDVLIRSTLVNPLRAGFFETLREMGANVAFENQRTLSGEPVADIRVKGGTLVGIATPASRAASMIDEYPILAVVAAFARGDTYMPGVSELRVKESDRLAAIEAGLAANGVKTESGADWLRVFGRDGDVKGGGLVATRADHRIAMSFLILGLAADKPAVVDDISMIATSYPNFFEQMQGLGASFQPA